MSAVEPTEVALVTQETITPLSCPQRFPSSMIRAFVGDPSTSGSTSTAAELGRK